MKPCNQSSAAKTIARNNIIILTLFASLFAACSAQIPSSGSTRWQASQSSLVSGQSNVSSSHPDQVPTSFESSAGPSSINRSVAASSLSDTPSVIQAINDSLSQNPNTVLTSADVQLLQSESILSESDLKVVNSFVMSK